jgi:hypothetical protein
MADEVVTVKQAMGWGAISASGYCALCSRATLSEIRSHILDPHEYRVFDDVVRVLKWLA